MVNDPAKSLRPITGVSCKNLGTADQLLSNHACCGEHSKAASIELLGLHLFELFRVFWFEAQWIEVEVSNLTVCLHRPLFSIGSGFVEVTHRVDLWDGDRRHNRWPEGLQRSLLEGKAESYG
jgi:hypothetical protein